MAIDGSGARMVAAVYNGAIYTSQDTGQTWQERPAAGVGPWTSISSDATGNILSASLDGGEASSD